VKLLYTVYWIIFAKEQRKMNFENVMLFIDRYVVEEMMKCFHSLLFPTMIIWSFHLNLLKKRKFFTVVCRFSG